jgi:Mg2+-importing ATPase
LGANAVPFGAPGRAGDCLPISLASSLEGLTWTEARRRQEEYGPNELSSQKPPAWPVVLWRALKHPFNGVLSALALVSFATGDLKAGIVMP